MHSATKYSQWRAMLAITRASLQSMLRSPSSVAFSIGFPLIFILVFGFLGSGGIDNIKVSMDPRSDTMNPAYQLISKVPGISIVRSSGDTIRQQLEKGRITALLNIQKNTSGPVPAYLISLTTSEAVKPQNVQVLRSLLNSVNSADVAAIQTEVTKVPGRTYRTIDFILPGQLGFSLLSVSVFGVAFLFFNLRQQLVLKRFYATPIRRGYIVLGEGLSRIIFQMFTAIIIVGLGNIFFHFTLVHGIVTFINILILSIIAIIVFMGFGFVVSSLAKSESTIPPFANMITLPQFLLAGTFFSIEVFPKWLQPICKALPLTHYNTAVRSISFEGASLASCWPNIGVLLIWGIVIYAIAIRVFKWE